MSLERRNQAMQPYQDTSLAVIEPRSLALPETPERKRFFLPTDVLISRYGVIGLMLLDTRPEQRWINYTDGEYIGIRTSEESVSFEERDDRVRLSHYIDTETGFKIIRYFVLPPVVSDFFKRDKFLGDPIIDKCCRDETLPEELDEIPADPTWAFGTYSGGTEDFVDSIIQSACTNIKPEELQRYLQRTNHRTYVSFHAWENLQEVQIEGEKSLVAALNNFDNVLERFDTKDVVPKKLQQGEDSATLLSDI